jgi:uncharacterized SAM-binding protein YcdF (DUF218 family)
MIGKLISLLFFSVAITAGISFYLQPDDLAGCTSGTTNCEIVDAIVAISGGDTTARTDQAIKLYEEHRSNVLIFSGAAEDKTGPSNAAAMRQLAIDKGVPSESIYVDETSETTQQNAINAAKILQQLGAKNIILVTSGYHQRRASLEFNKAAGDITVLNYPVKADKDWSLFWWLTPQGWWLSGNELVRIVMFYAVGV